MALIKKVRGFEPQFGENCFLVENATIVGDVQMGNHCSVWFQAVIRGDVNSIRMGDNVNIQDGAVIHGTFEKFSTTIGNNVSIGHQAMVHGCTIKDNVLIGMGAIVLDNAVIDENCLIAAGALILENMVCESGGIYAGVPAKKVKSMNPGILKEKFETLAQSYIKYSGWYKEE